MRVGDTVNEKYELLSLIGEGGMGTVYEARHTLLNRRFALKFLHSDLCEDKESQTRFLREAQAAAGIGSDHIVQVTDVGTAQDGSPYLVMELLDGPDLRQIIGREKIIDQQRAAQFALQLCQALGTAHAQGITHRDLKPENVVITKTALGTERLKVLDFGIAKFHDLHLTATGSVIGSPHYMSPEQARGSRDVDHRADIYAVGAMLFEMVTGEKPYTGKSMTEILVKVVTEPPPKPRTLRPDVSEAMEQVILKAMERDLDQRYATMTELADGLAQLLDENSGAVKELPRPDVPPAVVEESRREPREKTQDLAQTQEPDQTDTIVVPPTLKPMPERKFPRAVIIGAASLGVVLFLATGVGLCAIGGRACFGPRDAMLSESRAFTSIAPGSITMDLSEDARGGYYPGQATIQFNVTRRFLMLKTEVTQRQYKKLMGYNSSTFSDCGETCPVESLTWHEAAFFSNKLSKRRNKTTCYVCSGLGKMVNCIPSSSYPMIQDCPGFRLPTEAEWELAARAGTQTHTHLGNVQPFEMQCSPVSSALSPIAWYCANSNNSPHPVRSLGPNKNGLYDMLGNVSEWCNDYLGPIASLSPTDPTGAPSGNHRVVRGGGFDSQARLARSGARTWAEPHLNRSSLGFRVVRSARGQ